MKKIARYGRILCIVFCMIWTCGCAGIPADQRLQPVESIQTPKSTGGVESVPLRGAPQTAYRVTCENYLELREKPLAQAEAIGAVRAGESVRLLDLDGRYARVELENGKKGYILSGYLQPQADEAEFGLQIVQPTSSYSYDQMQKDLRSLEKAYPHLLQVQSIGKSTQDRDILVARVGDENAEYHLLVQAGIHGREHMTALLAMAQLESFLQRGGMQDICLHILPMTNPDGATISQTAKATRDVEKIYNNDVQSENTTASMEEYMRQWKANGRGVDLNRNFDAQWEKIDTRLQPSASNYRGERAASEPETQCLCAYSRRYALDATISYHASGSVIFWEFGENAQVNRASQSLAEAVRSLTAYPLEGDDGTSFGGYKDWANQSMGVPSITIEIGSRSCPLPEEEFSMIWLRNQDVLLAAGQWLRQQSLD